MLFGFDRCSAWKLQYHARASRLSGADFDRPAVIGDDLLC